MYRVPVQRPAGGGRGVSAGVLAGLGGVAGASGVVAGLVRTEGPMFGIGFAPGWVSAVSGLTLVIDVVSSVLLLVGAVLVFVRRGAGPTLVALGCAGAVGAYALNAVSVMVQMRDYGIGIGHPLEIVLGQSSVNAILGAEVEVPWVVSLLLLVFPMVTFVLAVLPSTRRWCKGAAAAGAGPAEAWAGQTPHGMPPGVPGQQGPVLAPGQRAQWGQGVPPQRQWGQHPQAPQGPGEPAPQGSGAAATRSRREHRTR
ncbi:hypothetical protein [Nocardia sp. NPDC003979]